MKLLGLEGKGLLISVGITIIMCGAVTYYCHMRVKNVEVALMKQNQVLTSFITNVQNEIRKGGLSEHKQVDVSSPEARNAVKNIENSKIEVSDDSETDDSESTNSDTKLLNEKEKKEHKERYYKNVCIILFKFLGLLSRTYQQLEFKDMLLNNYNQWNLMK